MKTIIVFLIALSMGNAYAQDVNQADVPSVVGNALKAKYPNATDVEWELKNNVYKADFETGKTDHDIWIDTTGKIVKHTEDITKGDLPADVTRQIGQEFKSYTIDDAEKIEVDGVTTYEVELDGTEDRKVTFDAGGKVLTNIVD